MKNLVSAHCGLLVLSGSLLAGLWGCDSQTSPTNGHRASDSETGGLGKTEDAATDNKGGNGNSTIIKSSSGGSVSSTGDKSVASINGVSFEVRGKEDGESSVSVVNGRVAIKRGANKLDFKDGKLVVNGRDAGTVKTGDEVLLDESGKLFVNKQER